MTPAAETPYGFTWGALDVERMADLPDGRVVVTLSAKRGRSIDVYCSRTGRSLRVFDDEGNELTP